MSRLIDVDALCEFANNTKDKTVDANDIMRFPTVDVEPLRHGEWILDTDHHWDSKFKCSRCEYETDVDTCFGKPLYNYCPYCGARMDGEMSAE